MRYPPRSLLTNAPLLDFSRIGGPGGWYCNLCTDPEDADKKVMTLASARKHERGTAHAYKLAQLSSFNWLPDGPEDNSGWFVSTPYADLRAWEKQGFVDRQKDVIPFWKRGVDAAERGEEAEKWEDFLDHLEEKYNKNGGWDVGSDGWGRDYGANVWGVAQDADHASHHDDGSRNRVNAAWGLPDPTPVVERPENRGWHGSGKRKRSRKDRVSDQDPWTFVEEVARQEAASAERTKRMHEFFSVCTITLLCRSSLMSL